MFPKALPNQTLRGWLNTIGLSTCLLSVMLSCSSITPPSDVSVRVYSIRSLYPDALEMAREWKEDAYLVDAAALFSTSNSSDYPPCNFSFRSHSTDIIGLFVVYKPTTGQFKSEWVSIAQEDPQRYPEIKESDWRIDSIEALEVAQDHGGAEFLSGRSADDMYLDLFLRLEKRQQNGQPLTVWRVSYNDLAAAQSLSILIDASTGQVVETSK